MFFLFLAFRCWLGSDDTSTVVHSKINRALRKYQLFCFSVKQPETLARHSPDLPQPTHNPTNLIAPAVREELGHEELHLPPLGNPIPKANW